VTERSFDCTATVMTQHEAATRFGAEYLAGVHHGPSSACANRAPWFSSQDRLARTGVIPL
jgi:hypothetical protein